MQLVTNAIVKDSIIRLHLVVVESKGGGRLQLQTPLTSLHRKLHLRV